MIAYRSNFMLTDVGEQDGHTELCLASEKSSPGGEDAPARDVVARVHGEVRAAYGLRP
jgi:hypothetical protein